MTEQERKVVLAMPEDELFGWCVENIDMNVCETLPDLALRLRGEWAKHGAFYSAMLDVQEAVIIESHTSRRAISYKFWAMNAAPVHWILAALLAKENE